MAQDQVLRARRCADRVGLDKTQLADGARQRGRLEQAARYRIAAKRLQRDVSQCAALSTELLCSRLFHLHTEFLEGK
jgi:hypothetical protein